MRWFVLGSDGNTYGPVDLPTLAQWAGEGRLAADTSLREEMTGALHTAADITALQPLFAQPVPVAAMPCPHCGAPMPAMAQYCGACGSRPLQPPKRKLTGITALDGVLGVVTVIGLCAVTWLLMSWHLTLGGLTALLPIVTPIVLVVALGRTHAAYARGLAGGCFLVGCVVPLTIAALVAFGIHQVAGSAATDWSKLLRCGF